jgi:hypothetical protein
MDKAVRTRITKPRKSSTIRREVLAWAIADLEETRMQCLADLPPGLPAPDDFWHQARLAYAQFLAAWIKLEESRLEAMVKEPPAVC